MNKKCWGLLITMVFCGTLLAHNIFLLPSIAQEVGVEFSPPKVLNTLLFAGFLFSMALFGLARQKGAE